MRTGFLERSPNNKSMMRLLAFIVTLVCSVIALWGMFLATLIVIGVTHGKVTDIAILGTISLIISGALAIIAGTEGLKVLQQRGEAKETNGG